MVIRRATRSRRLAHEQAVRDRSLKTVPCLPADLAAPMAIQHADAGTIRAQSPTARIELFFVLVVTAVGHFKFLNSAASFCLASSADLSGFHPSESLKW